ncbi:Cell pattern formation-associated protein STUA [Metarhizium brunneum]|uniref:Cell pattern formation-associated protein STUA n=1 Tax=Metarhizium brunneum TaxID=500148 RepID=A0A7D5YVB8_9HYPO
MNHQNPEMYYPQHISGGQPPPPQTVTSNNLTSYQHPPHLMQPGPSNYSNPNPYGQYPQYANGLTSPSAAQAVSNPMGAAPSVLPLPGVTGQASMANHYAGFDTTGQNPPPGMKPRVTATLWEDEGSLCFQVEARGICVARREDNHMINGTKLLNVAGMTRGRRDGILKSEKVRHVVKIGPMHLKGVWIPYERALDFANKEKITEMLYPLFVHNIGALLYHPTNQTRTSQVMAAAERRKQEQSQIRPPPPPPGLPSIQQHQQMALPGSQTSLPSHGGMGSRPTLDRAHTFPTPPGNPGVGGMGASDNFGWQGQAMNGAQGTNPLAIETGLNSTRSMPNTPATTPPGQPIQNMQPYHQASQGYDNSRQMYGASASQQSPYQNANPANNDRIYSQPSSYPKSDMGPPSSRPAAPGQPTEQHDAKSTNGIMQSEQSAHGHEEEGEPEHEAEYTHNSGVYDASRSSYNYTAPSVGNLANDANINPDMTGSPGHPSSSGRATPRTAAPHQSYYPQNNGYNTPPRVQQTTSNLYNVVSNDRGQTNAGPGGDVYAPAADMPNPMPNGYAPQPPLMNGASGGMKRGREDDEDLSQSGSEANGMSNGDLKRRRTIMETTVPAPAYDALNRPAPAMTAPRRR